MRILPWLAIAVVALAGCSSKSGPDPYTCQSTGTVIDLATVEGSDAKDFDPESACPAPVPPSVSFTSLPASMMAYFPEELAWDVAVGNHSAGHSMFTGLVVSRQAIPDDQLVAPSPGPSGTLCSFAHQELPKPFSCKIKFENAGTYHLRAYAQIRAEGLPDGDYWTREATMTVTPVAATGVVFEVSHGTGPAGVPGQGGSLSNSSVQMRLGDALVLVNKDVVPHTFTFSGSCQQADLTVAASTGAEVRSDPVVMRVPGSCVVTTDDVQPQTLTLNVAEPA